MFNKEEVKSFFVALVRKWMYPDFNNKLTWWVAGAGGAVLLAATPLKVLLYSWLVDSAALNIGAKLPIAEFGNDKADYWMGIALILGALFHNLVIRYISCRQGERQALRESDNSDKSLQADRAQYERIAQEFPAYGRSLAFLRNHDFCSSFSGDETKEVQRFVDNGYDIHRKFLDAELESERLKLLDMCREFLASLDNSCGPDRRDDTYSCIPEYCYGSKKYPAEVEEVINRLNNDAVTCYNAYCRFVLNARKKLNC